MPTQEDLKNAPGGETTLGLGGAQCATCDEMLPSGHDDPVWSEHGWLFCDEECAKKWNGRKPAKWQ